jgi:hypothetical protein
MRKFAFCGKAKGEGNPLFLYDRKGHGHYESGIIYYFFATWIKKKYQFIILKRQIWVRVSRGERKPFISAL